MHQRTCSYIERGHTAKPLTGRTKVGDDLRSRRLVAFSGNWSGHNEEVVHIKPYGRPWTHALALQTQAPPYQDDLRRIFKRCLICIAVDT
jgi:hypothetical protein